MTDVVKSCRDMEAAVGEDGDVDVAALPKRGGWILPLTLYRGFWLLDHHLAGILAVRHRFNPRADDIFLVTQPKSGTTWLKAMAFAVINRHRFSVGDADHPLLRRSPHEIMPFLEGTYSSQGDADIDSMASPRLLATHIPLSVMPPSAAASGALIVYLCRDPRDVFVSLWHFEHRTAPDVVASMEEAFDMYCAGESPYGPVWEHNAEYWTASLARPEGILLLKYEEAMADPASAARKVAGFLGREFTEEEERGGEVEKVVRLCSFEKMAGVGERRMGSSTVTGGVEYDLSTFYRKGMAGDWKNHLSPEMGEKLRRIVEEKLLGLGLSFAD